MTTPLGRLSDDELRAHGPWLVHLARGLVSESEAEDLAQDVWLELARGSGPIAHLRALAASIARRLAGHRRAAERAREERERRSARAEALPGADELQGVLDAQRVLLEELSALDELHRTPLLLHYYEGLSAAEIARRRGQPATTVRHQLERARRELRARLERRHGGERALWVALVARVPRRAGWAGGALAGGMLMTTLGKTCLAAGVLGALLVGWRVSARGHELAPAEGAPGAALESAALVESQGGAPEPLATPTDSAGTRSASALAPPAAAHARDVTALVLDEANGLPLREFVLWLWHEGDEPVFQLTTDAGGRATIEARWFEAQFHLRLQGDHESSFEYGERELGPADRPADGEPLVLTCASGPGYTLLFDAPAPPVEELRACLSAGTEPPVDPLHFVRLHRDGARVWTRFPRSLADARLGDGPWTLSVLSVDGLWRAHGPVATIIGEQREPVRLASELCGALTVELECDDAPEANDFALGVERLVEGKPPEPWHAWLHPWQSERFFGHLVPGEYEVWASSPVHETARQRVRVAAGASEVVRLALVPRAGVAALRVVITSETGTLDLAPLGAMARELATGAWKNTNYSEELHPTRLELLFEGLTDTEYEVTLDGLVTFGALDFAPGRSQIARPSQGELVFTALDAHAPPRRKGRVRVLSDAGEPLREATLLTYFDGWSRGSSDTDAEGVAHLEPLSAGVRFDLVVWADGFRPRVLRELALPFEGDELEVRLEPGWGAWIDVVAPSTEPPSAPPFHPANAAGARVLVDGEPAGVLDERGHLLLERDAAPRSIEILYPGHHVAAGALDLATGAPPRRGYGVLRVELAPDAR